MPDAVIAPKKDTSIVLSSITKALMDRLRELKNKPTPNDYSKITVSQTVSFVALVYEKIRNAVEYREDHLIRRAAIERIIKRRLSLNPEGKEEAENILRELLWARYFDNGSLGAEDVKVVQSILDKYMYLKRLITPGRDGISQQFLMQFLLDMLTCEIEETLTPRATLRESSFTFFIYQVLRLKVKIEGVDDERKDAYFLTAVEKAYRKSDNPSQRYHLFITFYKPFHTYTNEELHEMSSKLPSIFKRIDLMIKSPYVESLTRFTRKQLPPFLILFSILSTKMAEAPQILAGRNALWTEVDVICREKYDMVNKRLRNLAIKSFIYIFLTKMIFVIILEYPVSLYLYNEISYTSIGINSLFPPILMLLIISVFRIPGEDNTKNIYQRIIEIIDADNTFETGVAFIPKKGKVRRPILIFGFTIFYTFTFMVTLLLIRQILQYLHFNLISQAIFIFFVSVVTFFSYRIKHIVNEYRLIEKEGVLTPIVDFFFMPILSLGKFFSSEISKLNFFIFIFDFLIEAPFKFVFEIVEEWISFVKKRKEEIM